MQTVLIVLMICALFAVMCVLYAGTRVNVRKDSLEYNDLPESFDGYKIAVIADFHDRKFCFCEDPSLTVAAEKPDIILLAGDMHNRNCERTDVYSFEKRLSSICPVYYIKGNHEPQDEDDECEKHDRLTSQAGVHLLYNKSENLVRGAGVVALTGISWNGTADIRHDVFTICLTHSPLAFDNFKVKPSLTVAGHIHGGFIELPFVGGVFAPGEGRKRRERFSSKCFFPKYYKGVYGDKEHRLVVTRGLGFSGVQFRFIPAEVNIITLVKSHSDV